ncbi:hypothetical protein [Carboxylicivirga sp. RSCT41]|uniref:hypothetical protein n=1 Tax=Carboxylicivirga agarovorans TaxID=3417570 RepID=UPI003D35708A
MYNITLITTTHTENGKCNSQELYKIIDSIKPDVIFEEMTTENFDLVYNKNQIPQGALEVKSIKEYLKNHIIKHIPVDIPPNPDLSTNEIKTMFDEFKRYEVYKNFEIEQNKQINQLGFNYINSKKSSQLFKRIEKFEISLISFGQYKNNIHKTYKRFHAEQNNRENAMLQNIYSYAAESPFSSAIFFIGCAHRNSIIEKIRTFQLQKELNLNWTIYNPETNKPLTNILAYIITSIAKMRYLVSGVRSFFK